MIPKQLYYADLASWNDQICSTLDGDVIKLDFSETGFLGPFHMIFLLHRLRMLITKRPRSRIQISNFKHLEFAAHMGFFQAFNADFGKKQGQVTGDANFIPITIVNKRDFMLKYGAREIHENIDSESKKLTTVLTRLGSGNTFDLVQYSMREIIRNIFEHSGTEEFFYCAQYWPQKKRVQLCIADEGMGVAESLKENSHFQSVSDRNALQYALLPGISGNARALSETKRQSNWQNSGYGLYMVSRLCRNSGGFLIISSNHLVNLRKQQKWDRPVSNFKGTLVKLDLDLIDVTSISNRLKLYAEEGKRLSVNIGGAKIIEASTASQMLTRDFD
jgi:hemerythrin superfamily protein